MRYYEIVVSDASGNIYIPAPMGGFTTTTDQTATTYSSLNAGANISTPFGANPAALRVELDITSVALHIPAAEAKPFIKVHGVDRLQLGQASQLNGKFIRVSGGMSAGLPLANPFQAGLLTAGQIQQCFGNWLGVDQNINFYIVASSSAPTNAKALAGTNVTPGLNPVTQYSPANLVFQWSKGQPLMAAIATTLQNAFPLISIAGAVNAGLVWTSGQAKTGYFQTLQQFAAFINQMSIPLVAGPYPVSDVYNPTPDPTYRGVQMVLLGSVIYVTDFSTATNPKQIAFTDLIGQPTWSKPGEVQCTCVMRGDINLMDYVQLPPDVYSISATAATQVPGSVLLNNTTSPQPNGSLFVGIYTVQNVRHVGDSRQAGDEGAAAWVTVLDLVIAPEGITPAPALPFVYQASSNNSFGFTL